jgi:hypothetical protein
LEERVSTLLGVWENWSLFPSSYLRGLEAFFSMSETDSIAIREQSMSAAEYSKDDAESIKRKAKLLGIAVTDAFTVGEVQARVDYVERFSKAKNMKGKEEEEFSITVSAGARERGGDERDRERGAGAKGKWSEDFGSGHGDDDVDGIPMSMIGRTDTYSPRYNQGGVSAFRAGAVLPGDVDIDGEEYDDVDGVPFDAPQAPGFSHINSHSHSTGAYDDDDVDGVPLDLDPPVPASYQDGKRRRSPDDQKRGEKGREKGKRAKGSGGKYASDSDSDGEGDGPGRIDFL